MSNPNPDCPHYTVTGNQRTCAMCNDRRERQAAQERQSRRVSDVDRDAVAEFIKIAHGYGALDLTEMNERLSKALEAKFRRELDDLTSDLPSVAEMTGKAKVPGRFRKFFSGWHRPGYPALTLSAVGGMIVSVVSAVFTGNLHVLPKSVQFSLVAFFIASGVISLITTIIAGVCWIEEM